MSILSSNRIKKKRVSLHLIHRRRRLAFILALQVLLLVLFVGNLLRTVPNSDDKIHSDTITVEEMRYVGGRSSKLKIYSDDIEYTFFPRSGAEYGSGRIYADLQIGDTLSIQYYEYPTLFGPTNRIVDAKNGETVYRTLEESRKSSLPILGTVCFFVVEAVFTFAFFQMRKS